MEHRYPVLFDGPHLALRDLEGVPIGRLTKQHRQDSDGELPVINGVQGAVVADFARFSGPRWCNPLT